MMPALRGQACRGAMEEQTDKYDTESSDAEIPAELLRAQREGTVFPGGGVRETSREEIPVLSPKELVGVFQAKKDGHRKSILG